MTETPTTYQNWVCILKELREAENDDEVLEAMRAGTIVSQHDVIDRVFQRLVDVLDRRVLDAVMAFEDSISRSCDRETQVARSVDGLGAQFRFIHSAADIPALPERHRDALCSRIREQADAAQASLEKSAERNKCLARVLRDHKVNDMPG